MAAGIQVYSSEEYFKYFIGSASVEDLTFLPYLNLQDMRVSYVVVGNQLLPK